MPDLSLETTNSPPVIGIDEAGRGPWAGPVTVAAFWINPDFYNALPAGLDDSKKLTAFARARIFGALTAGPHKYAVTTVPVAKIDALGILQATLYGMRIVAEDLAQQLKAAGVGPVGMALVDGNMSANLPCPEMTVIKGDSKSCSIAAASIIAKQSRDALMDDLAREFPAYGWQSNKGYGTRQHHDALRQNGITPHHRRSFAPIKKMLSDNQAL